MPPLKSSLIETRELSAAPASPAHRTPARATAPASRERASSRIMGRLHTIGCAAAAQGAPMLFFSAWTGRSFRHDKKHEASQHSRHQPHEVRHAGRNGGCRAAASKRGAIVRAADDAYRVARYPLAVSANTEPQ